MKNYHSTWYVTKTLLYSEPDTNRRTLYRGDHKVVTFNEDMDEWPKEQDKILDEIVRLLNSLTQPGRIVLE